MAQVEPQFASDYDDRTTVAVKSVLVEIGQVLGSYKGKFAVIGGAVPWLLLNEAEMPHVGTLDVDLSSGPETSRRLSNLDNPQTAVRKRVGPEEGTIHDPGQSFATHTCR